MSKKDCSFVLYGDMLENLDMLSDEDAGRLFRNIAAYSRGDPAPCDLSSGALMLFNIICQKIDRDKEKYGEICEKRQAAIRKRWEQKNTNDTNEYKSIQKNTNDTEHEHDKEHEQEREHDHDHKKNNKRPSRHRYGVYENVLLSDEERDGLKEEFRDFDKRVDALSEYMESSGRTYKNHCATIRTWARREKEKGKGEQIAKHERPYIGI